MQSQEDRCVITLDTPQSDTVQKNPQPMERTNADFQKAFDSTFLRAVSINETAYKINISIYVLMMGFGVNLILDATIISAFYGVSLLSVILGALGFASLGSVLAISPQGKIAKNAARSLQYQLLYNGYVSQLEVLKNPDNWDADKSVDAAERISLRLEQLTSNTVDKIESLNGDKPSPNSMII